jgi:hypothetical protein
MLIENIEREKGRMNVCVRPIERKRERIIEEHRKREREKKEIEKEIGKERQTDR